MTPLTLDSQSHLFSPISFLFFFILRNHIPIEKNVENWRGLVQKENITTWGFMFKRVNISFIAYFSERKLLHSS